MFKLSNSNTTISRSIFSLNKKTQAITKDPIKEKDDMLELVKYVNDNLKDKEDKNDRVQFWQKLKKSKQLIKLGLTPTNFENKFLNLIYDHKLDANQLILNSLKDYYLNQRIDQDLVRKCAYGQLLLMLKNRDYDDEIESILESLIKNKILSETISTNFIFAYARSSLKRFNNIYPLLDEFNFKNFIKIPDCTKLIEFMEIAYKYQEYDKFFAMFRLLFVSPKDAIEIFRSKSEMINDEELFLKFLSALNLSRASLFTEDIDYLTYRLSRFNYKTTKIDPKNSSCPNCDQPMPGMSLEELKELENYFLAIFTKEINQQRDEKMKKTLFRYIDYLYEHRNKFDLIVDSLNSSFQGRMKFGLVKKEKKGGIDLVYKNEFFEHNLINSLESFNKDKRYKNILIIGRYSQLRQVNLLKYLKENNIKAKFFNNFVEDDLAIILASVFNYNSRLITNDYFNDHLGRIQDEKMKRLFRKHIGCCYATSKRKNLKLNYHNEGWDKIIHISDANTDRTKIHVPFNAENVNFKNIYNWFCFTKQT